MLQYVGIPPKLLSLPCYPLILNPFPGWSHPLFGFDDHQWADDFQTYILFSIMNFRSEYPNASWLTKTSHSTRSWWDLASLLIPSLPILTVESHSCPSQYLIFFFSFIFHVSWIFYSLKYFLSIFSVSESFWRFRPALCSYRPSCLSGKTNVKLIQIC